MEPKDLLDVNKDLVINGKLSESAESSQHLWLKLLMVETRTKL